MITLILRCSTALTAVACLSLTTLATAAELKIAYVSVDRVLASANLSKSAESRLKAEFDKQNKEIQDLGAKLKAGTDKLEKDAPVLSEADRLKRQRELTELNREFQRRRQEFTEDLNMRRSQELSSIVEKANKVIKQIAESEKYDLILQEAVHVSPKIDITDKVVQALNASK